MSKFYFAFAWDIIVNLQVRICKNKEYIYTRVFLAHANLDLRICKNKEYIYTRVFLAHANLDLSFYHGGYYH